MLSSTSPVEFDHQPVHRYALLTPASHGQDGFRKQFLNRTNFPPPDSLHMESAHRVVVGLPITTWNREHSAIRWESSPLQCVPRRITLRIACPPCELPFLAFPP